MGKTRRFSELKMKENQKMNDNLIFRELQSDKEVGGKSTRAHTHSEFFQGISFLAAERERRPTLLAL